MKRVFVYEYLSGGGLVDDDPAAGDTLLPLGMSMRDAIVADLLRLADCAVTAAVSPRAAGLPGRAAGVCAKDGESPFAFVARQAQAHDLVWLVAPETGGLLAQFGHLVGPQRWIGCAPDAIELTTSKRATLLRLAAHGVTTPLAFENDPLTHRWVTKPDDGAGGVATRAHPDRSAARDDWAQRTTRGEAVALEPWVDGDALSVSLLCGPRCVDMLSVNRQDIAVAADGRLSYEGVDVDVLAPSDPRRAALARLATQVAQAIPGLRGFVGIDLVWHDRRGPVVIEVNPRVTCAYVGLSAALGRNLAAEVLAAHGAEPGPADA